MDIEKMQKRDVSAPYFLDHLYPNISETHYGEVIDYFHSLKSLTYSHRDIGNENKTIIADGFLGSTAENIVTSLNCVIDNYHAFHKNIDTVIEELESSKDDIIIVKNALNNLQEELYDTTAKFRNENGYVAHEDVLAQQWNTTKQHMVDARKRFDTRIAGHNEKILATSLRPDYKIYETDKDL